MFCSYLCIWMGIGSTWLTFSRQDSVNVASGNDYGSPVFLTPYIMSGDFKEAREAASVSGLHPYVRSYSGFLTVNETHNSNMFFWYFPAESNRNDSSPVVLWLQGGPGVSSLFGLFHENGPFRVKEGSRLGLRPHRWSRHFHLVYIDNPVGTGFSFTEEDEGYAMDEEAVGRDLYNALHQFLSLFHELSSNELYITGESYAGKYVPALAYSIHKNKGQEGVNINLKGMAIGNGYIAPDLMLDYGDYLYQIGLIDFVSKKSFKDKEDKVRELIARKEWLEAGTVLDDLMGGSFFHRSTGFRNVYNYLDFKLDVPSAYMGVIQKAHFRKRIHVGNLTFHMGNRVASKLRFDIPQSVKPWFETLVEHYRVLVYSGQLDIIVAYPLTLNFLQNLNWSGAEDYKKSLRKSWWVGGKLAGYSRTVKKLTEVLVRDAGHMVPMDQPLWAYNMIMRFIFNKQF